MINNPTVVKADSNPYISGPVNLVSGTNVTLVQTGQSITINSTGGGSGMVYPSAGIAVSTGSAWGTSISGTTSQYITGAGTLVTFPSLTGFVPYTGATNNVDLGTHSIQTPVVRAPSDLTLLPNSGYLYTNSNRIFTGIGSGTTILNNNGLLNINSSLATAIEVASGGLTLQADLGEVHINTISNYNVNINSGANLNLDANWDLTMFYDYANEGKTATINGYDTTSFYADDFFVPNTYGVAGSLVKLADNNFKVDSYGNLSFDTPHAGYSASHTFAIDSNANTGFFGPSFNVNSDSIYINGSYSNSGDISILNQNNGNYIKVYGSGGPGTGAIDIMSKDNTLHMYSANQGNGINIYDNGGVEMFAAGGHDLSIWNDYNTNGLYLKANGTTLLTAENGNTLHLYNDNNGNGFEADGGGGILIYANNGSDAHFWNDDQGNGLKAYSSGQTDLFATNSEELKLWQDNNGNGFFAFGDGTTNVESQNTKSINLKTNGGGGFVNVDYMATGSTQSVFADSSGNLITGPSNGVSPQIPELDVFYLGGTETQHHSGESSSSVALGTNPPNFMLTWRGADTSFLAYNPSIWLFEYKYTGKNSTRSYRRKSWVHPVHLNGSTHSHKRWASGSTGLLNRVTEFNCPTTPTTKVQISIDPKEYRNASPSSFMTDVFPYNVSSWEQDPNCAVKSSGRKKYNYTGGYYYYPAKTNVFRFCIVIENPDTTSDIPFLFGPMSDEIHISPKKGNLTDGSFYYSWMARLKRTKGSR